MDIVDNWSAKHLGKISNIVCFFKREKNNKATWSSAWWSLWITSLNYSFVRNKYTDSIDRSEEWTLCLSQICLKFTENVWHSRINVVSNLKRDSIFICPDFSTGISDQDVRMGSVFRSKVSQLSRICICKSQIIVQISWCFFVKYKETRNSLKTKVNWTSQILNSIRTFDVE